MPFMLLTNDTMGKKLIKTVDFIVIFIYNITLRDFKEI